VVSQSLRNTVLRFDVNIQLKFKTSQYMGKYHEFNSWPFISINCGH